MNKKVYVEAGAVDGEFDCRSLHLKDREDYFGILVEPNPYSYKNLVKNRLGNNVLLVNAALVPDTYKHDTIKMRCHPKEACSSISICQENRRTDQWDKFTQEVDVKALTLQTILEQNNITEIEWLYLDTEGFEEEVLNGIDHTKTKINNAEIEVHGTKWPEHLETGKQVFVPLMKERYGLDLINIIQTGCPKLVFSKK
jgi:FkbM family methyltransferase